jgi:hypothetical protein
VIRLALDGLSVNTREVTWNEAADSQLSVAS